VCGFCVVPHSDHSSQPLHVVLQNTLRQVFWGANAVVEQEALQVVAAVYKLRAACTSLQVSNDF